MFLQRDQQGFISGVYIGRFALAFLAAIVGLFVLFGSWFTTPPGYVTLVVGPSGVRDTVYEEGFHFKMPLLDKPRNLNMQSVTWAYNGLDAGTADMQRLTAAISANVSIDKTAAKDVFRNFRDADRLAQQVLQPAVEESLKAVTSKYRSEQIIAQRQQINSEFIALLRARVKPFNLLVNQVNVTNLAFSPAFMTSIENKVAAEQNALKAVHDLTRIKTEAEQKIAEARGQAESIRVQAEAITKNGGAEYVQLQWIAKWDGKLPTHQLGTSTTPMLSLGK